MMPTGRPFSTTGTCRNLPPYIICNATEKSDPDGRFADYASSHRPRASSCCRGLGDHAEQRIALGEYTGEPAVLGSTMRCGRYVP
jgi:hypothetical protein